MLGRAPSRTRQDVRRSLLVIFPVVALSAACSSTTEQDTEVGITPRGQTAPDATISEPPDTATPSVGKAGEWPYIGDKAAACFTDRTKARAFLTVTVTEAVESETVTTFGSEASVVHVEPCHLGPGQTGGGCKPFIIISDTAYAGIKQPMTPTLDLVVLVPDAAAFEKYQRYKVVYEVCPAGKGGPAGRLLEASKLP